MNCFPAPLATTTRPSGFSLVEMLVVIAIVSILMTVGSIGLKNLGGRGVASGVDTAEALVDEARSLANGKNLRTALLVAKNLDNNPAEDRRRILVAHEELELVLVSADGEPEVYKPRGAKDPNNTNPNWQIVGRGALLPEQTFYSETFSRANHDGQSGEIDHITHAKLKFLTSENVGADANFSYKNASTSLNGEYYVYRFNAQGMPIDQDGDSMGGASFVIGTGSRMLTKSANDNPPKVVGSALRDFGGFVIWRNGRTSVFRSPNQISSQMTTISAGTEF